MAYLTPSHRSTSGLQPEICELCGMLVENSRLFVADVEGLRGRRVCDRHGSLTTAPSAVDYILMAPFINPEAIEREEPIGAAIWWDETGGGS